jgi:putative transposase
VARLPLWPRHGSEVTGSLRWLTHTHTMRWHAQYHTRGTAHLYRGRFKSFPVGTAECPYTPLRSVERNPSRAGLVRKAENWPGLESTLRPRGQPKKAAAAS